MNWKERWYKFEKEKKPYIKKDGTLIIYAIPFDNDMADKCEIYYDDSYEYDLSWNRPEKYRIYSYEVDDGKMKSLWGGECLYQFENETEDIHVGCMQNEFALLNDSKIDLYILFNGVRGGDKRWIQVNSTNELKSKLKELEAFKVIKIFGW